MTGQLVRPVMPQTSSGCHVLDEDATVAIHGSMQDTAKPQKADITFRQEIPQRKRPSTQMLHAVRAQLSNVAQSTTKSFQISQSTTTKTFQIDKRTKTTFKLGQTTTQTIHVGQTTTTTYHDATQKHASKPYQFRAAGPMILRNPTQKEIQHLRLIVSLPNSPIRYIVMRYLPAPENSLLVFAQAVNKHTATAWKRLLVSRMEQVSPPIKSVLHAIKTCQGLDFNENTQEYSRSLIQQKHLLVEEYGTPSRLVRQDHQTTISVLPATPSQSKSQARPQSELQTFISGVPLTSIQPPLSHYSESSEFLTLQTDFRQRHSPEMITRPSKASQAYAMAMQDIALLSNIPGLEGEI